LLAAVRFFITHLLGTFAIILGGEDCTTVPCCFL
jgi:hypothetical protein